jgi:valyl-tRNA synthetase
LEFINIFTDDGKINEYGGPFQGLQRFDARVAVLEALKEKGLYVKTEDNKMVLPMCGRSGNIVEPLMKPQWWINCQDMAKDALEVSTFKKLFLATYFNLLWSLIGCEKWGLGNRSSNFRTRMVPMARKYSRLVHLTSALVGSSNSCLLC